jgi:hypothetical protein
LSIKVALTDLENAIKYLKSNSTAYALHIKAGDVALIISTIDANGQAVELHLYDTDKSSSKAKVVLTEQLDRLLKTK